MMDVKRKAGGAAAAAAGAAGAANGSPSAESAAEAVAAAAAEQDERAAKRRKILDNEIPKAETPESTTQFGLDFLKQLRGTKDKRGRPVAHVFEKLPPRTAANARFYEKLKRPISLRLIERKLQKRRIANLAELEGYLKRMVTNTKEYYPKGSEPYDDAERIRKASSNYMRSHNPAYLSKTYIVVPITLDPDPNDSDSEGDGPDDDDDTGAGIHAENGGAADANRIKQDQHDADSDPEPARHPGEPSPAQTDQGSTDQSGHGQAVQDADDADDADDDGDGDEEDEDDEEEEDDDEEADDDEEDDEEEEDAGRDEPKPQPAPRRRGPGRPPKDPAAHAKKLAAKAAAAAMDAYENVPYVGLTFQQAQEKIVEELIRRKNDDDEPQFDDFINLPPRSLKEYYRHIQEPMALAKLQKLVRGIQGRNTTGTTLYKTWDAFETACGLLWDNAYYFNEEDSQIYNTAKELEDACKHELAEAKKAVQEPAGVKIKLKVPTAADPAPAPALSRKITLHSRSSRASVGSPAPTQARPAAADPAAAPAGASASRSGSAVSIPRLASSAGPSAAPSPAPSAQPTMIGGGADQQAAAMAVQSPALNAAVPGPYYPRHPAMGAAVGGLAAPVMPAAFPAQAALPPPLVAPQAPPGPFMWTHEARRPGKSAMDGFIARIDVRTLSATGDDPFLATLSAHPQLLVQRVVAPVPNDHSRSQIIVHMNEAQSDVEWKMFFFFNRQLAIPTNRWPSCLTAAQFDLMLSPGTNTVEIQVPGAIRRTERVLGGPEAELERIIIHLQVPARG